MVVSMKKRAGGIDPSIRKFDLNIEKILEDWEVYHGIREVIANALDEQLLTNTKDIDILKGKRNEWHIRDYGRGLRYEHLTQKENLEKLKNPNVIGKFGIGLKDALATFDRKGIDVSIKTKFGEITLGKSEKHGFEDIVTLHAYIYPPVDPQFQGTEFILEGVTQSDIDNAKNLFLKFSGDFTLEKTQYGDILKKGDITGRIYINGVKVADENNFLFSYNITSLTKSIRKALNRERSNVGRTAYTPRVKNILLSCTTRTVAEELVNDLKNFSSGTTHDELNWLDIQEHAVKILNAEEKTLFITSEELIYSSSAVDEARDMGYKILTIPKNLRDRIRGNTDVAGKTMVDLDQFRVVYTDSFTFNFIDISKLSKTERAVYQLTNKIFELIGGKPRMVKEVNISDKMRSDFSLNVDTTGVWEPSSGRIIIKRSQLKSIESYSGTLIHEIAHAKSRAPDSSRHFELELTRLSGVLCSNTLKREGEVRI